MAKKEETKDIRLEPIKQTIANVELVGTSDLILCKKSRSYERAQIFAQSHPKGTKLPKYLDQPYNVWQHLITSITWDKPIVFHDDDYSLYSEEEWVNYMTNNAPCILSNAFSGAMNEAWATFGFKEGTGKNGTDFKRAVNFMSPKFPIAFAEVEYEQKLVPNNGLNKANVIAQYNLFHNWKCNVQIAIADTVFPYETILELLAVTGKFIGVGTQRKNGYGHFEIGEVELKNGLAL